MQHDRVLKSQVIFDLIAEIIKEERLKQGKSLRILADEFDIQQSLLSRLENAKNEPKLISIITVCEALNLKTSEFFSILENRLPKDFSIIEK